MEKIHSITCDHEPKNKYEIKSPSGHFLIELNICADCRKKWD